MFIFLPNYARERMTDSPFFERETSSALRGGREGGINKIVEPLKLVLLCARQLHKSTRSSIATSGIFSTREGKGASVYEFLT